MKKIVQVAAGIIFNAEGQVLIAERRSTQYKSGLWEFPGGKLEQDELFFQALRRELFEEIGIVVEAAHQWMQVAHEYPERFVILDAWIIDRFSGTPQGLEGQMIRWIHPSALKDYVFPEGNKVLLEKFYEIVI